ncbi:histone deacetylase complex protein [Lyophyllum atratum]|nr:histone deacetylase complex protein [Lyophyllum atratum]
MPAETATVPKPPKRPAVFVQDACYQHQYIRSRDLSAIVERPERLRAVTIGLSAAIARLEAAFPPAMVSESKASSSSNVKDEALDPDDLAAAMGRMNIVVPDPSPVSIVRSHASVDLLHHPAVKYIHGDIDGDVYMEKLTGWARDSWEKIREGGSEIPEGLPQGDLYRTSHFLSRHLVLLMRGHRRLVCPESINAIQGAIGTVCEAVDRVIASSRDIPDSGAPSVSGPPIHRAFVAIRPPGHHCGEDSPSGFCFVNNVAIGAAHAHLQHGINRVVILDIDLHHGNGTQSLVWQINEETYRQKLEVEAGAVPPAKPGLQAYYGSIHDVLSFPCEDGKPELIQAASVSLHHAHGQYIENVHLQTYTSEEHFWDILYKEQYTRILRKAEEFLDATGGPGDDVLVFISCGMDACEHEYASMSRHNRKVPTSFYNRFARDVCARLGDRYARGRVVSVLEGGYSDRALMSGAMAHLAGLADDEVKEEDGGQGGRGRVDEEWWSVENLVKLENATKKRRGGRTSLGTPGTAEPWLERTVEIFNSLDASAKQQTLSRGPATTTSMTLRDRKAKSANTTPTPSAGPQRTGSDAKKIAKAKSIALAPSVSGGTVSAGSSSSNEGDFERGPAELPKKLPRVVLRLGPDPSLSS